MTACRAPPARHVFDPEAGRLVDTAIWQWLDLPVGHRVAGPAVIEHPETTVYVANRQTALVDEAGNLDHRPQRGKSMSAVVAHGGSTAASIDPITFEVIRHKLQAITEEQAITLKSISGSPVVTDATDFNNGLYLGDGSIVTMGPQVIFHTGTMSTVIRSIIENFEANPGIRAGDMFILNDPYRGAIHQPDVSIVAPIFAGGRRIAWAGSCAHQLDTGGMAFGSWAYSATDVQQEAMLLPGVKLVENGEVREDIWQMIMGMSRLPEVIGLDFKGMIAANNVAIQRLNQLFDRYGVDTVEGVMNAEIDASEERMRARLSALPDGVYRARDYIDHDGLANRLYRVCLAVEKKGDELDLQPRRHVAAGARLHQLHLFRHEGRAADRSPADPRARHPLERGGAPAGEDRGSRSGGLQREVAGPGLRRDHLDGVDRHERCGGGAVATGQRGPRHGARGAGGDQRPDVGADLRRPRSRR